MSTEVNCDGGVTGIKVNVAVTVEFADTRNDG
jgi:hypothetical protein